LDAASRQGRGWAGEDERKREGKGREGEVEAIAPPDPLAGFGRRFAAGEGLGWGRWEKEGGERQGGGSRGDRGNRAPQRRAMPLCHFFSNIDVASKYCLYYVNYLLFGQLTFY